MCLLADRAERHGSGAETLHDLGGRLDLLQRHRVVFLLELEQTPQGAEVPIHVVDRVGEIFERLVALLPNRVLQLRNRIGIENVPLTPRAELIFAADIQLGDSFVDVLIGVVVTPLGLTGQHVKANAFDLRSRPHEIALDDGTIQPHRFEDLGPVVALHSRDPHLRHHFEDALLDREDVVVRRFVKIEARGEHAALVHVLQRLERHIGIDGVRAVTDQQAEVHHLSRFARLDNQPHLAADSRAD